MDTKCQYYRINSEGEGFCLISPNLDLTECGGNYMCSKILPLSGTFERTKRANKAVEEASAALYNAVNATNIIEKPVECESSITISREDLPLPCICAECGAVMTSTYCYLPVVDSLKERTKKLYTFCPHCGSPLNWLPEI